jgi:hypothetical protein
MVSLCPRDAQRDVPLAKLALQAHSMLPLFASKGAEIPLPYRNTEGECMFLSSLIAEIHLVAHPVGRGNCLGIERLPKMGSDSYWIDTY